jgi:hypothetical protein
LAAMGLLKSASVLLCQTSAQLKTVVDAPKHEVAARSEGLMEFQLCGRRRSGLPPVHANGADVHNACRQRFAISLVISLRII